MNPESDSLSQLRSTLLAWPGLRFVSAIDREDLVQDALRLLHESGRLRLNDEELVRYALGVLRHLRALLVRRRLQEQRLRVKLIAYQTTQAVESSLPVEELSRRERIAALNETIAQMGEPDRTILRLRTQGIAFAEIASELGVSSPVVRQRYLRALKRVRDAYFDRRNE